MSAIALRGARIMDMAAAPKDGSKIRVLGTRVDYYGIGTIETPGWHVAAWNDEMEAFIGTNHSIICFPEEWQSVQSTPLSSYVRRRGKFPALPQMEASFADQVEGIAFEPMPPSLQPKRNAAKRIGIPKPPGEFFRDLLIVKFPPMRNGPWRFNAMTLEHGLPQEYLDGAPWISAWNNFGNQMKVGGYLVG